MTILEIPVTPENQSFSIQFGGIEYNIKIIWNDYSQNWNMSISTSSDTPIVNNLPLLASVDTLEQLHYLRIGEQINEFVSAKIYAESDLGAGVNPGFDTFGEKDHLKYELPI